MREIMDVIDIDDKYIYLLTTRSKECATCSMNGGCNILGGSNELKVRAKKTNDTKFEKGDKVLVELPNVPIAKLSFLAYGIPLIVFISIVVLFSFLNFSDIISFSLGIIGLISTYFFINLYDKKRLKDKYLPTIISKVQKKVDFNIENSKEAKA